MDTNFGYGKIKKTYPDVTTVTEYPPPNPIRKETTFDPFGFDWLRIVEYRDGSVEQKERHGKTTVFFTNGTICQPFLLLFLFLQDKNT